MPGAPSQPPGHRIDASLIRPSNHHSTIVKNTRLLAALVCGIFALGASAWSLFVLSQTAAAPPVAAANPATSLPALRLAPVVVHPQSGTVTAPVSIATTNPQPAPVRRAETPATLNPALPAYRHDAEPIPHGMPARVVKSDGTASVSLSEPAVHAPVTNAALPILRAPRSTAVVAAPSISSAPVPVVTTPLALLDPPVGENPASTEAAQRDHLANQFAKALGGLESNPADPAYLKAWQDAQPAVDDAYRAAFGDSAFNAAEQRATALE